MVYNNKNKFFTKAVGQGIVINTPRISKHSTPSGQIFEVVYVDLAVKVPTPTPQEFKTVITKLQFFGLQAQQAKKLEVNDFVRWVGLPYISQNQNLETSINYNLLMYSVISFSKILDIPTKTEEDLIQAYKNTNTFLECLAVLTDDIKDLENTSVLNIVFNSGDSEKGIFMDVYTGYNTKAKNIFTEADYQNLKKGSKIFLKFKPYNVTKTSLTTGKRYVQTKGELLKYYLIESKPTLDFESVNSYNPDLEFKNTFADAEDFFNLTDAN